MGPLKETAQHPPQIRGVMEQFGAVERLRMGMDNLTGLFRGFAHVIPSPPPVMGVSRGFAHVIASPPPPPLSSPLSHPPFPSPPFPRASPTVLRT